MQYPVILIHDMSPHESNEPIMRNEAISIISTKKYIVLNEKTANHIVINT
jgi:hypothetical protein